MACCGQGNKTPATNFGAAGAQTLKQPVQRVQPGIDQPVQPSSTAQAFGIGFSSNQNPNAPPQTWVR